MPKAFRLYPLVLFLFTGCTIHRPSLVSSSSIGPKETALAIASGESSAIYILFFGPFGDNSLAAAVDNAKFNNGADTMMNVFVDQEIFMIPLLFTRIATKVHGTLVIYNPPLTKPAHEEIKVEPAPEKLSPELHSPI